MITKTHYTPEIYERRKQIAIAVLGQRTATREGMSIDRFAAAIGVKRPRRPSLRFKYWPAELRYMIADLVADGTIVYQKDYPLLQAEPWRVYLAGQQPVQCLTRGVKPYRLRSKNKKPVKSAPSNPLPVSELKQGTQQKLLSSFQCHGAGFVRMLETQVGFENLSTADFEIDLRLNTTTAQRCTRVWCELGVFDRVWTGKHYRYSLMPAASKQFSVGAWVIEFPGKPSQRVGRISAIDANNRLTVRFDTGEVGLSSAERAYAIAPDFVEFARKLRPVTNQEAA